MPYHLPDDYVRRTETVQLDPLRPRDVVWQPDVVPHAAARAVEVGASTLVDVGCGNGAAVAREASARDLIAVGIDAPQNVERITADGLWVGHNLDKRVPLPLDDDVLDGAVIVCADVIEHLTHPERLRNAIAKALTRAHLAVFSTPDRALVRGPEHMGPPPNTAHAQEWTLEEFVAFLGEKMTVVAAGHTRQRDTSDALSTCLVEVTA